MTIEQKAQLDTAPFPSREKWLEQYIMGSYYFSQGSPALQDTIDAYTLHSGFSDYFSLGSENDTDSLKASLVDEVTKFFTNGGHSMANPKAVEMSIQERFSSFESAQIRLVGVKPDSNDFASQVLDGIYLREKRYLIGSKDIGRSLAPSMKRTDVEHPRFAVSLLVNHLIDARTTGHPVFDLLFRDMRIVATNDLELHATRMQRLENKVSELRRQPPRDILALLEKLHAGQ